MLAALLTTTLTVAKPSVDGSGSETVQDKVFLLSMAEVGLGSENGISEGSKLAMFSDNNSRRAMPTAQAVSNSEYTNSSLSASQYWYWWLRSPYSSNADDVRYVYSGGSLRDGSAYHGSRGVRPALTLKSDLLVSVPGTEDSSEEDMTPEQREMALYEAAVEKFGEIAQIDQATEEMAELIVALNKYKRYVNFQQGDKEEILAHIAEERADVEIMLNQLHVIFGDNTEKELEKLAHLSGLVGMEDAL